MANASTPDYVRELETTVDEAMASLAPLSEFVVTWRPAPGTWCAKEIIGHLIDSAANNHPRFVRAISQPDLVFPGYAQDEWVRVQAYDRAAWTELLILWRAYNLHLARVMAAAPAEALHRRRARHNLDEIAWQPMSSDTPATLDDLMRDYVGHLQHHLGQVRDRVRGAAGVATDAVAAGRPGNRNA
jgi:hypothetical protein